MYCKGGDDRREGAAQKKQKEGLERIRDNQGEVRKYKRTNNEAQYPI